VHGSSHILKSVLSLPSRLMSMNEIELFHLSHVVLLVGIPVALLLSPSRLIVPIDLLLGIVIPYHAHLGMIGVIDDYVPVNVRSIVKTVMVLISITTTIGILKINLCGVGLTETFKALWRKPKQSTIKETTTIQQTQG